MSTQNVPHIYKDPEPITRAEWEKVAESGDKTLLCEGLVGLAFHEADWRYVQQQCLGVLHHSDASVKGAAATCLGHVARIHGEIDLDMVVPALQKLKGDVEIGGRAEDALDDIAMFVPSGVTSI